MKLQTYDLNYVLGKTLFGDDVSQNMFTYWPRFNKLELKEDKGTDYILNWKSKGVYTSKLRPLYIALLHGIRSSGYKIGIKFNKDPLATEQNNYAIKIVNAYIVYELDTWPKNLLDNFKFKNCLFGATNTIKNSDKEKWVYSGYGIAFNGRDLCNFGNDLARNVVIFGVDNSTSTHADTGKNNFLMIGVGPTYSINGSFGLPEKEFSINYNETKTNVCLSFYYNHDNSYLFVNGKRNL